ncbi:MAG: transcriptional repressor [Gemmatimonadetes bacterium]|nr:transcriptional repressor [Gemmatimonadota bacterium]
MSAPDTFREFLRSRDLPVTEQRMRVATLLFSTHKHVSVEEILERLQADRVEIGKATVYRTLDLLVDSGLVREHDFGEGFKRYEYLAGPADHEHLICESCNKLIEFTSVEIEDLKRELARAHNFQPRFHRVEVYGLCEDCGVGAVEQGSPADRLPKAAFSRGGGRRQT